MANQKNKQKNIQKKKGHTTGILFVVLLVLILLPFAYFGWTFLSSYMESKSPVLGNRFKGDLNPAIQKEQLSKIDETIAKIDGVQGREVHLKTATLRVYLDMKDDTSADTLKKKTTEAYQAITKVLPVETYFTQKDGKKMYDVEIHAYNTSDSTKKGFAYVLTTKNSLMKAPSQQLVSKPVNEEVAKSLRDAVEARKKAKEKREAEKKATNNKNVTADSKEKPAQ
ncbi:MULTISPECIES: hypothetical protein [Terrabacteria group]|uniref:hypothetical protein n=1 Tax=Bacillati TaxID=1783272 RepID=UPI001939FDE1|nr:MULTISPECIES: hypothetical protein [Terrabacteria group]MBW9212848.1 hypothetical protein [Trueperella sp. zg.1013]QRG86453.1 hypothetical protein JOS54_06275 [Bulleidia sp. zg-1006]